MKSVLAAILLLIPGALSGQLDNDGKRLDTQIPVSEKRQPRAAQVSLMYTGTSRAPFGVKFEYWKLVGGYASFRSDYGIFEKNYELTIGFMAPVYKYAGLFLGGGVNAASFYKSYGFDIVNQRERGSILFEAGAFMKFRRFAFEAGVGAPVNKFTRHHVIGVEWQEDMRSSAFIVLGIGYNFMLYGQK
jgi:hypothetical protein